MREKRVFIPFWKGTGFIMDIPEHGLRIEDIRKFVMEQLQSPDWMQNLSVSVSDPDSHRVSDESIGWEPPESWA